MTQYISKRVYDAIQWRGNNIDEIRQFFSDPYYGDTKVECQKEFVGLVFSILPRKWLFIGDWFVIDKIIGEMQVVDNQEFYETFELVEGTE